MHILEGPALKKAKSEPVSDSKDIDFDEFDDDFDETAMLNIDDSQFFCVDMPNTTESEVMEVDAPFETPEQDNKEVNVNSIFLVPKKMPLNFFWLS